MFLIHALDNEQWACVLSKWNSPLGWWETVIHVLSPYNNIRWEVCPILPDFNIYILSSFHLCILSSWNRCILSNRFIRHNPRVIAARHERANLSPHLRPDVFARPLILCQDHNHLPSYHHHHNQVDNLSLWCCNHFHKELFSILTLMDWRSQKSKPK